MKVEVKIDKNITETTIIILAKELDDEVYELQQNIANINQTRLLALAGIVLSLLIKMTS